MSMIALLLFAASLAFGQDSGQPRRLRLSEGTPIDVRAAQTTSSEDAAAGDRVDFLVTGDVKVNGLAVITRGSLAWGAVREAAPRGRMARNGKLEIEILGVCRADGARLLLRAYRDRGVAGGAAQPGVGESLMAIPALPILMFVQGKETKLERGRELTVYSAEDMQIDSDRLSADARKDCISTAGPAAPIAPADVPDTELASVSVRSNPVGAEIQVDGRFAGNSPSTLRLPAGPHRFLISLPGRRVYDRVVELTPGGEVSIAITLEERGSSTNLASKE